MVKARDRKLLELQQHVSEAEQTIAQKERELQELQHAVAEARQHANDLEEDVGHDQRLEQSVQRLLQVQREATAQFNDYENRVLVLELQSLVERYRLLDVDVLSEQNHELRSEVLRLQAENMGLSRQVAEASQRSRADLARLEHALEGSLRERLASARERIAQELHDKLDSSTRNLVGEHGALQDAMQVLAQQAAALDVQYRLVSTERRQYKVDSEVEGSMRDMQSKQVVLLRQQLDQAYVHTQMLQVKCEEATGRCERAEAAAQRSASQARALQQRLGQALAKLGPGSAGLEGDPDLDSALGAAGAQEAELGLLRNQLLAARQRCEQAWQQRDRWRDRSLLYEKACAQLQASLQTVQQQASVALPPGAPAAALDAIWCSASSIHAQPTSPPDPGLGKATPPGFKSRLASPRGLRPYSAFSHTSRCSSPSHTPRTAAASPPRLYGSSTSSGTQPAAATAGSGPAAAAAARSGVQGVMGSPLATRPHSAVTALNRAWTGSFRSASLGARPGTARPTAASPASPMAAAPEPSGSTPRQAGGAAGAGPWVAQAPLGLGGSLEGPQPPTGSCPGGQGSGSQGQGQTAAGMVGIRGSGGEGEGGWGGLQGGWRVSRLFSQDLGHDLATSPSPSPSSSRPRTPPHRDSPAHLPPPAPPTLRPIRSADQTRPPPPTPGPPTLLPPPGPHPHGPCTPPLAQALGGVPGQLPPEAQTRRPLSAAFQPRQRAPGSLRYLQSGPPPPFMAGLGRLAHQQPVDRRA